jgi:hypothetical protein
MASSTAHERERAGSLRVEPQGCWPKGGLFGSRRVARFRDSRFSRPLSLLRRVPCPGEVAAFARLRIGQPGSPAAAGVVDDHVPPLIRGERPEVPALGGSPGEGRGRRGFRGRELCWELQAFGEREVEIRERSRVVAINRAVERYGVTKTWVIERLKQNVERCMQVEPVLDAKGNPTEELLRLCTRRRKRW